MPLTRKNLDKTPCGQENCTHNHDILYLHCQECLSSSDRKKQRYSGSRLSVFYTKATGTLTIECSTCGGLIANLEIAEGGPDAEAATKTETRVH